MAIRAFGVRVTVRRVVTGAVTAVCAAGGLLVVSGQPALAADGRGNLDDLERQASAGGVVPPGGSGGSSASGDFIFAYPLVVPPGRKGQQPSVSLNYSSGAATHGGVAAGWSLSKSVITVDPEASTMQGHGAGSPSHPRNFVDPAGNPMVRDVGLPVSSGGVGYRALGDTSFTRYEYLGGVASEPFWWRAFGRDGTVSGFGLKTEQPYSYAPLVSVRDGDGHELRYDYDVVDRASDATPQDGHPREILPRSVNYHAPGDQSPYARVLFHYDDPAFCGASSQMPVGSTLNYRYGFGALSGTRKLTQITTWAKNQMTGTSLRLSRAYELGYDVATESCSGSVTPFRQLLSVQQKAYPATGTATVLPPTEFTYGKAASYVQSAHYTSAQDLANVVLPSSIQTHQVGTLGGVVPGKNFLRCPHLFCPNPGPNGSETKPEEYDAANMLSRGQADGESMQAMWLDINGDGRVDLLRRSEQVELGRSAPGTGGCQVEVYVNKGSTGFVKDTGAFSFSLRDGMADIPVSVSAGSDGDGELLCTLSRSFSSSNSGWRGDPAKPCAGQSGWTAPASWGSMQQVLHSFLDVDGDRRPDLVSVPVSSIDCPYASTSGVPAPTANGSEDVDWIDHFVVDGFRKVTRRQKWAYVYRNTGTGFESTPQRHKIDNYGDDRLPFLPQSSVRGHLPVNAYWANLFTPTDPPEMLLDLTGDGTLDRVSSSRWNSDQPGHLRQGFGTLRYTDRTDLPDNGKNSHLTPYFRDEVDFNPPIDRTIRLEAGVTADVNGDGLVDHAEWDEDAVGTEVAFNTGFGFGTADTGNAAHFSRNAADTKYLESYLFHIGSDKFWNGMYREYWGYRRTNMVDLDYDGLPDQLFRHGSSSKLYLNGGWSWVRHVPADEAVAKALAGQVTRVGVATAADGSSNESGDRSDYVWQWEAQSLDINADGLLDLVGNFDSDPGIEVRYARNIIDTSADHAAPARLLRTITNGYGARTTVKYGRSTAAGKWFPNETTTSPGQNEPEIVTKHSVGSSVWRINPYGQAKFRGFARTVALRVGDPDDEDDDLSVAVDYSYTDDVRGRVTAEVTVLGDDVYNTRSISSTTPNVMSVVKYTHHVKTYNLYAGGMTSAYPSNVVLDKGRTTFTCAGGTGQTYGACVAAPAAKVADETEWQSQSRDGRYVMELAGSAERGFLNADGDQEVRRTTATYHLAWSSTVFNAVPASVGQTTEYDGRRGVSHGSTSYVYHDPEFRRLHTVTVADPASVSRVTRFTYHGFGRQAGQVARVWQPEQVHRYGTGPAAAGYTELSYDRFGIHPIRATNPVGHVVKLSTDLATGAVLETFGPGYTCPDGADSGTIPDPASACSFDGAQHREGSTFTIDGLGRPLTVSRRPIDGGNPVVVQETSYDDLAAHTSNGATPVSRTTQQMVNAAGFGNVKVETDGLGRPVRQVTSQFPNPSRVVSYDYDAAGRPSVVHVPRGDSIDGTVDVRTTYDPLGRVTSVYEIGMSFRPFVEHSYDGVRHTMRQGTPLDDSRPAETVLTYDPVGQLIKSAERSGVNGRNTPVYAATSYRYDGLGRVMSMTDPDAALTEMTHDYAGNRLTVTTAKRKSRYGYDRNDNQVSFTEPVPAGGVAADYTHTRAFDDVNRVTSETPARRDLTDAERGALWIGPKTYHYDQAHPSVDTSTDAALYQVGQLSYTTAPNQTVTYGYDRFAGLKQKRQALSNLPGAAADTLVATASRSPAGTLETLAYSAVNGSATTFSGRTVSHYYDRDGLAAAVTFPIASGKTMHIVNDRDDSGVVTKRRTNVTSAAGYASPTVSYDRDQYGRLKTLQAMVGDTQAYRQAVFYADNGEIKLIQEQLGAIGAATASTFYTYDDRHQLTEAEQLGGVGYHGTFSYTPGGRMASADVSTTGTATRVPTRDVAYRYQDPETPGGDPQRLMALRNPDGSDLAEYSYDQMGNVTSRTLPDGTTIDQRWDGSRLRTVSRPDGAKEVYYYDGATRVAAVRYQPGGDEVAETRRWFGDLEVEYRPGSAPKYRQYLNLGGETVGRIDQTGSALTFEHHVTAPQGHQVLALAAESGQTRRIASYGPFGEVLSDARTGQTYPREFNGKEYDPTGGLHYYGYRYHDPLALQWTSTDPKYRFDPAAGRATPRRANLYTFSMNNPVSYVDPDGREPLPADGLRSLLTQEARTLFGRTPETADPVRTGVSEVNGSVIELSGARRNFLRSDVQVDVGHVEGTMFQGTSMEAMLITVNQQGQLNPATGGVEGSKVEIGIATNDGALSVGRVLTYTTRDGVTYEASGSSPFTKEGDALGILLALRELNKARQRDQAFADADRANTRLGQLGKLECPAQPTGCDRSDFSSLQSQANAPNSPYSSWVTDEHNNLVDMGENWDNDTLPWR